MDTETMIRELERVEENHKDDRVFTGQLNIAEMAHDVKNRLEELKPYEDTGLTPEQIRELKARDIIRKHMDDGWIPVEERLPDESLNSVIGWDEYRERCCFVQYYGGRWMLRADREPIKITHWRPLPEPYRPERIDT